VRRILPGTTLPDARRTRTRPRQCIWLLRACVESPLADLNPDAVIRDVLPKYGVHPGTARDSLDAIELRLAIEEEHRARDLAALALVRVAKKTP
jgi:hypothetical protein